MLMQGCLLGVCVDKCESPLFGGRFPMLMQGCLPWDGCFALGGVCFASDGACFGSVGFGLGGLALAWVGLLWLALGLALACCVWGVWWCGGVCRLGVCVLFGSEPRTERLDGLRAERGLDANARRL